MTELHWTDVDGVTVIWTEARTPLMAGLLFRTGCADETLATSGQTHLVEHLALSTMSDTDHRQNGFVGGAVTGLFTQGRPEEVSAFILGVCRALRSLPGARLEAEKQVVAAEAATQSYSFVANLLQWRYGAVGYGLTAMPELGFQGATLAHLRALAEQRFTSENAVLWLSGPLPPDLRFDLPHGARRPLPPLTPVLPTFPCWIVDDACGGVAVAATVPRTAVASIFCEVANRRLRAQLRTKLAVSYSPFISYEPLNADVAHLALYADSEKEHRAELAKAFARAFERFGEIDDAEVESARDELLDSLTGSLAPSPEQVAVHEVQQAAMDWILGREHESTESLAAEAASVGASDLAAFGRAMQHDALFALPGSAKLRKSMGARAPASTAEVVQGQETPSVDAPVEQARLVYGPAGVSFRLPDASHCTVRYSNLAGALSFQDGAMRLIGADGATLAVEPTLWRNGPQVCREIRERIPAHLLLDQGSRTAEAIPKPYTNRWQRLRTRLRLRTDLIVLAFAILAIAALLVFLPDKSQAARWIVIVLVSSSLRMALDRRKNRDSPSGGRLPDR